MPQVQKADLNTSVVGVVYRRFEAETKVRQIKRSGQVEQQTSIHTHSTEGAIAPGEYLLIVVLGPAQVKADAMSGSIRPGNLLTASSNGQAVDAVSVQTGEVVSYPPGAIIGTAMEQLDAGRGTGTIWVLVMPR